MPQSTVSVVIPTYLGGELLREAIGSLKDASNKSALEIRVIVVDNSADMFDRAYSIEADRYYSLPNNPGFGTAANMGFEIAENDFNSSWVMLLNPDARVALDFFEILEKSKEFKDPSWSRPIIPLISFDYSVLKMKMSVLDAAGLVGVQILDLNDEYLIFDKFGQPIVAMGNFSKFIPLGGSLCLKENRAVPSQILYSKNVVLDLTEFSNLEIFPTSLESYERDFIVQNAGSEIYSTFSSGDLMTGWLASSVKASFGGPRRAWCGAGVLLPKKYLSEIGKFNNSFFLYYEDTELSFRGLAKGLYPEFLPQLVVLHKHSAITGSDLSKRSRAIWRSRSIFVGLTSGLSDSLILSSGILVRTLLSVLRKRATVSHSISHLYPEFRESMAGTFTVAFNSLRRRN